MTAATLFLLLQIRLCLHFPCVPARTLYLPVKEIIFNYQLSIIYAMPSPGGCYFTCEPYPFVSARHFPYKGEFRHPLLLLNINFFEKIHTTPQSGCGRSPPITPHSSLPIIFNYQLYLQAEQFGVLYY